MDYQQAGHGEEQQVASCNRKGEYLLVRRHLPLCLHRLLGLRCQPRHDLVEQVGRLSIHATYDLVCRFEIEAASHIRVVSLLVLPAESVVPDDEFGKKLNRRRVLQLFAECDGIHTNPRLGFAELLAVLRQVFWVVAAQEDVFPLLHLLLEIDLRDASQVSLLDRGLQQFVVAGNQGPSLPDQGVSQSYEKHHDSSQEQGKLERDLHADHF